MISAGCRIVTPREQSPSHCSFSNEEIATEAVLGGQDRKERVAETRSHRNSAVCVDQSQKHPSSAGIAWHGSAACKTRGDKNGQTMSGSVPLSQQPPTAASHRSLGTEYKEQENDYSLLLKYALLRDNSSLPTSTELCQTTVTGSMLTGQRSQ